MDVEDHDAWTVLSEYDIAGDWNLQARIGLSDHLMVHFSAPDGEGSITAYANGEQINPGDAVIPGAEILFQAHPEEGSEVANWIKNGVPVENHYADTLHIPSLESDVEVMVEFDFIQHVVDFFVDGDDGDLTAHVGQTQINPGDKVAEGEDIMFTAHPDPGFRVAAWYLNGAMVEDHHDEQYGYTGLDDDITISIAFEEAVSITEVSTTGADVFPNPAKSHVTVHADERIQDVRLINMQGQTVYHGKPDNKHTRVELSGIPAGIYILRLVFDEGTLSKRLQVSNRGQ